MFSSPGQLLTVGRRQVAVANRGKPAVIRAKAGSERVSARVTGQRMQMPKPARLSDPANIGCCAEGLIPVKDAGPGPGQLDNYMRLPVEQYAVLDGANIERLDSNLFRLSVPRLEFFDLWIEPVLEVTVNLKEAPGQAPKVVMVAQNCKIKGSDWVEQWKLNERFDMMFRAELKWQGSPNSMGGDGRLLCKTGLEVYCEVVPQMGLLPRPTLEGTCNAVLNTFSPMILRLFLTKLADDYHRWSTDQEYREMRSEQAGQAKQPTVTSSAK